MQLAAPMEEGSVSPAKKHKIKHMGLAAFGRREIEPAEKPGARPTKMSAEQAEYIGVPQQGPFKPDHHRY